MIQLQVPKHIPEQLIYHTLENNKITKKGWRTRVFMELMANKSANYFIKWKLKF